MLSSDLVYTLQTKLELESMKQQPQSQPQPPTGAKSDGGSSLFKLKSTVKAFQSKVNTQLQTAGIHVNNLNLKSGDEPIDGNANDDTDAMSNGNSHEETQSESKTEKTVKTVDKETRRLRDDIESLQTQMVWSPFGHLIIFGDFDRNLILKANLKEMLKQSMEEKDQLQKGMMSECG